MNIKYGYLFHYTKLYFFKSARLGKPHFTLLNKIKITKTLFNK